MRFAWAALLLAGCAAGEPPGRAPTAEEREGLAAALDGALEAGSMTAWVESSGRQVRVTWSRGPVLAADAGDWRLLVVGGVAWRLDEGAAAWRRLEEGGVPAAWDPFEALVSMKERIGAFERRGGAWILPGAAALKLEIEGATVTGWSTPELELRLRLHPGRAPMRFDDVPIPFSPEMSAAVRKAAETSERR